MGNTNTEKFATPQVIIEMAAALFKSYNTSYEMWVDWDNSIKVEVHWGDWKHDHLFIDWIFRQINGSLIGDSRAVLENAGTEITEENGSDCYSGIHSFVVAS